MYIMDLLIVAALTYFVYKGARKGLTAEMLGVTGWIIAAILALRFGGRAGMMVASRLPQVGGVAVSTLGFVIVLVGVHLLFRVGFMALKKMAGSGGQATIDKFFGALVGFVKGALIISIIALALTNLRVGPRVEAYQQQSALFPHMAKFAQYVIDAVLRIAPGAAHQDFAPADEEPPGS